MKKQLITYAMILLLGICLAAYHPAKAAKQAVKATQQAVEATQRGTTIKGRNGEHLLLNGDDPSGNCHSASRPVIRVPQDYATIQEAVNAAQPGDLIKVGKGEYRGAEVSKLVKLIGEGANTRITSGVAVPRRMPDLGFPSVLTVGFLISPGGAGAAISNFRIEIASVFAPPAVAMGIGVHVRHADDVIVTHNEIVGPGLSAFNQFGGVYLIGANRCIVAFNKMDGTFGGVELRSTPYANTPTTNNQVVHNLIFNMRRGFGLQEHRANAAAGFGPERPVRQNSFSQNFVQADVALYLFDQAGTLRSFISNNNFTHNDFTGSTTLTQENVTGMATLNYFFGNLGL